jgi:hypothetical protein
LTQRGRSIGKSKTSVSECVDDMVTVLRQWMVPAGSEAAIRICYSPRPFSVCPVADTISGDIIFGAWNIFIAADAAGVAEYFESRPRAMPTSVMPYASAVRTASAVGAEMATAPPQAFQWARARRSEGPG